MPTISKIMGLVFTSTLCGHTFAHDWISSRPDAHAPISVMGDHTHKTGELMLSYRYMEMDMKELLDGKDEINPRSLLKNSTYKMAPTKMTMKMHMLGLMYAPNDTTTLMAMLPYLENDMDMLMNMGSTLSPMLMKSSMESSGIGDIRIGALHNIYSDSRQKIHLNLLLSLPTGSIDEKNSQGALLPYAMQLGSGTYDLLPGITYAAQQESFSWGVQASAVIRLDENTRDYRLGNRYKVQSWVQKPLMRNLSASLRLTYEYWGEINGKDKRLNPMMSPLSDANLQGGKIVIGSVGFNLTLPAGNRLALEFNTELSQDLDGLQMAYEDSLVLGWQLSFK